MTQIALATCLAKPELTDGDRLLAAALAAHGIEVIAAPWNGPFDPFAHADLVVVRSTWDYPEALSAFEGWIGRLGREAERVVNPPALMAWNLRKTYLLELAAKGACLPPTRLSRPTADGIAEAMDALSLDRAVVKPIVGASARGVSIAMRDDAASISAAAGRMNHDVLVQALIADIGTVGETSLLYFGGAYSHAVVKRPAAGSILVQEEKGGRTEPALPPEWAIERGREILGLLPVRPAYARIDVVIRDDGKLDDPLLLMEVELIEPELFLMHAPDAAARYADALIKELDD